MPSKFEDIFTKHPGDIAFVSKIGTATFAARRMVCVLWSPYRAYWLQVAAAQAQQRAGAQREQELYSQPFSSAFRQSSYQQSARNRRQQQSRGRPGSSASSKPGPNFAQQAGSPIIDVESVTIDEQPK